MATFIQVQAIHSKTPYRLNIDQIVSYARSEVSSPTTSITLATGGAIDVAITPAQLDKLIRDAGSHVFDVDGAPV